MFYIFFYLGGITTALIIDYVNIVMPASGIKALYLNITGWNVYFIIVFAIPVLSLIIATMDSKFSMYEIYLELKASSVFDTFWDICFIIFF